MPRNDFEGDYKRVLCVCSANLLRSPTAAFVLSQEPFNFNTRSAGTSFFALIRVNGAILSWADEIVCMDRGHEQDVLFQMSDTTYYGGGPKPIICLDIPDDYSYRDPALMKLIVERYTQRATLTV